ncbi:MAG: tripartite tricarboxylate transporter substrate binding protein [Azoarcus sp.]|nr:tripartite tricarboxylate transporter substrate binding protein [Azoarcus sp.]
MKAHQPGTQRLFFRRLLGSLAGLLAALSGILPPQAAHAGDWPERQIVLIVPWPAGGETDTFARGLAQGLAANLERPVIVENKPGATGAIGIRHARGKTDGYTFLFANTTALVGNVVSSPEPVNFDPLADFIPVGLTVESVYVLWAHPSLGVKNFDELLARARDKSKAQLAFGITGNGAVSELSVEQLARHFNLDLLKVPYKGSAPQVADLIAGHIQIGTANLSVALGAYREGRLVPLLVIGAQRLPELPGVPATAELGITDPDFTLWDGLFAPAGTPDAIVAALTRAAREAVKSEAFNTVANGNGHRVIFQSGAEASARIANDLAARRRFQAQIEKK